MNPYVEQEYTEETVGTSRVESTESRHTTPSGGTQEPSTSHAQMLERKQIVELSSFNAPTGQRLDIKEKYKEIKARNERLKVKSYAHYLKMAPTNQIKLISAFDIKEGKLQMSFLKPTIQQPKSMENYLKIDPEVLAKDIHPIDQMELHKKNGEMVYSTLTNKAIATNQLQNSLNNISAQF